MMKYFLLFFISFWQLTSYANDECSNAIELIPGTTCNYSSGTFSGSTLSGSAPSCATSAMQDVWYKFTATDGMMGITVLAQSGINPAIQVFQGSCNGTVMTCSNYSGGTLESYVNTNFVPGQQYYIRVVNALAQLSNGTFSICLTKYPAPANDLCANATTLTPNATCNNISGTFSGALNDGGIPSCANTAPGALQDVWYKFTATDPTMAIAISAQSGNNPAIQILQGSCNGTIIACRNVSYGTAENYFGTIFIPGQEYYVRVINAVEQLTTGTFTICLTNYPTPVNDLCANATTLTPNATCTNISGTFSGALNDGGAASCASSYPNAVQDVWYKFTATHPTMAIAISAQSGNDPAIQILQGSCNGTIIACRNVSYGTAESYFNNIFIPGQEYYVRVINGADQLTTGTFTICLTNYPTPANDLCANATTLTPNATCTNISGTFSGALNDGGAASCASSYPNAVQDVWYKFTATHPTMAIAISAQSGNDPAIQILQGSCNGTIIACRNVSYGTAESYFNNIFIPGQEYYVRVINGADQLTTGTFTICLTNYPTPANDLCANATTLTPNATCTNISGTFSGALNDGGAASCASSYPNAVQDVWYKFTATHPTMAIAISAQSGNDPAIQILQGSCNGTIIACRNVSYGTAESYFNNIFIPGQEYYVRVINGADQLTTGTFTICLTNYPTPTNDLCANATTLTPNATCTNISGTFSGALNDGGAVSCAPNYPNAVQDVWYKFTATHPTMAIAISAQSGNDPAIQILQGSCNGTIIACRNASYSTSESYFNNIFIPGQEYYVRVINGADQLTTGTFTICLTNYPTPANDLCANATTLTPNATCNNISGTFSGSLNDGGAVSCAPNYPNAVQDVWYKFTATHPTMAIAISAQSGNDPAIQILQGSCNGTIIACRNFSYSTSESYFGNIFIPGQEYYVRVINGADQLTTGTFTICLTNYPTPANDLCANATTLTPNATCTNISGTFSGALNDGGAASCASSYPNAVQDVWYKFTATATTMSVAISAQSGTNPAIQLLQGGCNGTSMACANASFGTSESYSATNLIIGQEYYVRVINAGETLTTGTFSICLTGPAPATCTPSVTISTTTTSICAGTSVVFTAVPTNGGTSPSYQWKVNGNIVGTNQATYTTTTLANGSIVTCEMTSNAACASPVTAISNSVAMNVTTPVVPTFTPIPAICSGGTFTLPSNATNGISGIWSPTINNTATTTYTFTPNAGQCAVTTTMTVTVTTINTGVTIQGNTITASATGATYQWINCNGNQPVNGAVNDSFTPTASGSYAVMITQNGCTKTSECVSVTTLGSEEFEQNKWNLYPNPAVDQLFIEIKEADEIIILDMTGKIIRHESLKSGSNTINIGSLASGMYIVKSTTGIHAKFVKK
ncbi:T9SS type A sorting domain-containing protein [Flavobacterium cerinum]|uniref:T9SS type A sorting domain-containing protein n=1 Tax=Flavobacterium cerinum TaxID=2502784 RepID=A0ABY5IPM5_9FLAO|nr:T9SS type A sorting domain-containing protein [Flavobacterium cerinum]UUC44709.1 T9SS type A sorting domain-containing protein [Flavobacterium cerinum]